MGHKNCWNIGENYFVESFIIFTWSRCHTATATSPCGWAGAARQNFSINYFIVEAPQSKLCSLDTRARVEMLFSGQFAICLRWLLCCRAADTGTALDYKDCDDSLCKPFIRRRQQWSC